MPGLGIGLAAVTRESFVPGNVAAVMDPGITYVWELEWGSGNIKPLASMPAAGNNVWDVDLSTNPDTLEPKLLSDISNDGYFDLEGSNLAPLEQTAGDAYSVAFDGVNDKVNVDGAGAVISGDLGSISMWFKQPVTASSITHLYFEADSNNRLLIYHHGGRNELTFEQKGGGTERAIITTTTVEGNGWHHFVYTWDTSADESKLYLDGSADGTGQAADFTGTISNISIGWRYGSGMYYEGNINDVAFFDDVLTAGEASAIYNSGAPKDESDHSGLVGYWKFEENTGTSIADSSSNSNVATLVNGTAFATDTP
tara:strand:- start:1576 stop:2511 length:936 start_codon:yes stop_codon:yes gene_type:complete